MSCHDLIRPRPTCFGKKIHLGIRRDRTYATLKLLQERSSSIEADHYMHRLYTYDGLRRVSGLRSEPVVSVKTPTLIPTDTALRKMIPNLS